MIIFYLLFLIIICGIVFCIFFTQYPSQDHVYGINSKQKVLVFLAGSGKHFQPRDLESFYNNFLVPNNAYAVILTNADGFLMRDDDVKISSRDYINTYLKDRVLKLWTVNRVPTEIPEEASDKEAHELYHILYSKHSKEARNRNIRYFSSLNSPSFREKYKDSLLLKFEPFVKEDDISKKACVVNWWAIDQYVRLKALTELVKKYNLDKDFKFACRTRLDVYVPEPIEICKNYESNTLIIPKVWKRGYAQENYAGSIKLVMDMNVEIIDAIANRTIKCSHDCREDEIQFAPEYFVGALMGYKNGKPSLGFHNYYSKVNTNVYSNYNVPDQVKTIIVMQKLDNTDNINPKNTYMKQQYIENGIFSHPHRIFFNE